jgi:hypothetical protein
MANHITEAQIQTLLAVGTVGALYPYQLFQLVDALDRKQYVLAADSNAGAGESTLATIFASTGPNP